MDLRHHLTHAAVWAVSEYKEHSLIFQEAQYKGMREQKACTAAEWATPFQTKSCEVVPVFALKSTARTVHTRAWHRSLNCFSRED